jgi:protein-S-isoprenylcysteine O-methyltransferase Ste14
MSTEALSLNRTVVFASAIVYWGGVWIQARRVRRRTGRSTNTRPRGTKEKLLWAGWCFVVAAWVALPFLSVGAGSLPGIRVIPVLVHPVCCPLGIALIIAGYAGTLWCYAAMGNAWRMGINRKEKPSLVARGPYRFVRHPIYLFQVMLVGGGGLLLPSPLALAALVVHLICVNIKAADEEAYLRGAMGSAYDTYCARTGRWFPRLRKVDPAGRDAPPRRACQVGARRLGEASLPAAEPLKPSEQPSK